MYILELILRFICFSLRLLFGNSVKVCIIFLFMNEHYLHNLFFSIGFCALFQLINEIYMTFSINSQFASINRIQTELVIFLIFYENRFFISLSLSILFFSAYPLICQTVKKKHIHIIINSE